MGYRFGVIALLVFALTGCIGALPAAQPTSGFKIGAALLDEDFESDIGWTTYAIDAGSVSVVEGGYRLRAQASRLVFGINSLKAEDVIIEAETYYLADYPKGVYGVMCRADSSGKGYYFLISANGNYSIRRIGTHLDDALVAWQGSSTIRRGRERNLIRAVCVGDYLALYVNGTFVADVRNTLYHNGNVGVAVALPPNAETGALADIAVNQFRVWESD